MYLEIHGTKVMHSGEECGLYNSELNGYSVPYQIMDPKLFANLLNSLPRDEAIHAATTLRDKATEQMNESGTHPNVGHPIFRQRPRKTTPLSEVRQNIENTRILASSVLEALQTPQQTGKNIFSQ